MPFIQGVNGALYQIANNYKLKNHRCSGDQVQKDAITLAMVYANSLLAIRDFSVSGQETAIPQLFLVSQPTLHLRGICSLVGPTAVRI